MGGSTPSLECHEIDYLSQFPDPDPARRQVFLDQLDACRERLEAEGVELPAYTIEAIAADVVDIRRALGYDRWNIVGYGAQTNDDPGVTSTEVVLELMRTDGDAIRSVTMEAPTPPQLDPWTTQLAGLARALDEVSMACQEQPPCAAARPDLGATLADALARPRTEHELTSGHGDPITVVMDPAWLSLYLWRGIASFEFLPHIPSLTGATPEELAAVVASTTSPPAPHDIGVHGVLLSALCPQTGAATSPEERGTDAGIGLEMWGTLVQADSCARWPSAEPDGALDEPVTSDIPTLVLVGQFDPNATAAGARLLASTLTTAQVYEVPGATANVLGHSDCAREIRNSFVSDPEREPDTTCLTAASPHRFTI
jgi:pimeloyl-ACP methyl ester carboxylesterase